jgi:glycopeptide antibiotics resistance protein
MKRAMIELFSQIWPMIFICSVIIIILRIAYVVKNKVKFVFYKEAFMFCFILYMMCLFYVVTFQDADSSLMSGHNIIPFKEMFRYQIGSRLFWKNVIGNMLMFVPFGFFTAYLLRKIEFKWVFIITLIVSLTIEITQTYIGRVFDIDDVLLNVIGGSLGYYIFDFFYNLIHKE